MMRLRRVSVIVMLSLLTSAAMAHAECAWALWLRKRLISVGCPSGILNAGRLHRGDE